MTRLPSHQSNGSKQINTIWIVFRLWHWVVCWLRLWRAGNPKWKNWRRV